MSDSLDHGQVMEWRERLKFRLNQLEQDSAPILVEMSKIKQQMDLLDRLLNISTINGEAPQVSVTDSAAMPKRSPSDVVAELLREAGSPLHIGTIRDRYLASGNIIPGKGTESNLLSYIVRDRRFLRIAKGTYKLGLQPTQLPGTAFKHKRRKRRRRRRPRTRNTIRNSNNDGAAGRAE